MAAIYTLSVGFTAAPTPHETIQKALSPVGWARYAPNCWLVSTNTFTANQIADLVRAVVGNQDTIFVAEIKPENHQGYLHKETWEWFNKARTGNWT